MKIFSTARAWSLASLSTMFVFVVCSGAANAVTTLTFSDNINPLAVFPNPGGTVGLNGFTQIPPGDLFAPGEFPEFRVTSAGDTVSGGGEKTIIPSGGPAVQWVFADDVNFTAVNNSQTTPGINISAPNLHSTGQITAMTVANVGDVGLFHNAEFLFPGGLFGFLAPIQGSVAASFYGGNGVFSIDVVGETFTVVLPVAEAQWAGGPFPLGLDDDLVHGDKITFFGTMTNIDDTDPNAVTFDFRMTANHIITQPDVGNGWLGEDSLGFALHTTQWELVGTGVAPSVAIAAPAAATGVLTATTPGTARNDGRITQAELDGAPYNIPVDTVPTGGTCVGGCFAFTVSGIPGATESVVFPLSTAIPANAVYRKFINAAWTDFDTSGGDTIQSAPGAQGDCSVPGVFAPGLNVGDFCVQLTIADGGLNDADGVVDSNIIDPGGIGIVPGAGGGGGLIGAQSLSSAGCSASTVKVNASHRAEWFILAAFLGLLVMRRFKRSRIK